MGKMFALMISLFLTYMLGSIPTSFIFGKLFAGIDIRRFGSGNVGATNVYRVVGKMPGILTLAIDIIKGAIAVSIFASYFYQWHIPLEFGNYQILMALAVISGHNWSIFLNFSGGKGIATSTGALLILCPKILGIVAAIWVIVFLLVKIISVASIVASISLPVVSAFFGDFYITSFAIILCVISVFKHRSNIKRLIRGEERPLTLPKCK